MTAPRLKSVSGNTGPICSGCAKNRRVKYQIANARRAYQRGDTVKLEFTEPGVKAEHMWVSILHRLKGHRYIGVLSNNPRHLKQIKHGDLVEFDRKQVEAVFSE